MSGRVSAKPGSIFSVCANAAAIGHLVISTLHSSSASDVTNRVASFFGPGERDLVRLQLWECLRCVICQRLVPRNGGGRIPALELMFKDMKHISRCIQCGDTDGVRQGMQQTMSASVRFPESLMALVKSGDVDASATHHFAPHPETFEQMRLGSYTPPSLESIHHH